MKVLIISAGVGDGHDSAAKAIISTAPSSVQTEFLRLEEFMRPWQRALLITSYYHATHFGNGFFWRYIYQYGQKKFGYQAFRFLLKINASVGHRLSQKVLELDPDLILTTHFYTPVFLESIKKPRFSLSVLVTDYNWYNLWFHPKVNYYFASNQVVVDKLIEKNFNPKNIMVSGIPVRAIFSEKVSKPSLRTACNISNSKPFVVMMTGGAGLVPASKYISALLPYLPHWNFLVITGRNEQLYQELRLLVAQKNLTTVTVLGWTDKTADYIRCADLLITKPGGLTTSESVAAHTPLLLISPIPGHEEGNARYLEDLGVAVYAKTITSVGPLAQQILSGEIKLKTTEHIPATTLVWNTLISLDPARKIVDFDQPKN